MKYKRDQNPPNAFLKTQGSNNIFVLSKGDLETYLPLGYRAKDIDKLIKLLNRSFWPLLNEAARKEITFIADQIRAL